MGNDDYHGLLPRDRASPMIHPAREICFEDLHAVMVEEVEAGRVVRKIQHETGLHLFTYSKSCVYEKAWNGANMLARGLILHPESKAVVATPFPKFFNYGECVGDHAVTPFHLPFQIFDKMDGSLIIAYFWDGCWRFATKGSFDSEQAKWAAKRANGMAFGVLDPKATYLFEAIYPENRIVVQYDWQGLCLLGGYHGDGREMLYHELYQDARDLGCAIVPEQPMVTLAQLAERAKSLPKTHEGWVIRFENGHRVKIKGAEYLRLHRMLSHLTPLSVWDMMMNDPGATLTYRQELPEEFWLDFDTIYTLLYDQIATLIHDTGEAIKKLHEGMDKKAVLSDKEVGLRLPTVPENVRRFIFPYRQTKGELLRDKRTREALFRAIRPTGNVLPGYVPSTSTQRVLEEIQ